MKQIVLGIFLQFSEHFLRRTIVITTLEYFINTIALLLEYTLQNMFLRHFCEILSLATFPNTNQPSFSASNKKKYFWQIFETKAHVMKLTFSRFANWRSNELHQIFFSGSFSKFYRTSTFKSTSSKLLLKESQNQRHFENPVKHLRQSFLQKYLKATKTRFTLVRLSYWLLNSKTNILIVLVWTIEELSNFCIPKPFKPKHQNALIYSLWITTTSKDWRCCFFLFFFLFRFKWFM